jgi:predicted lipoprotein
MIQRALDIQQPFTADLVESAGAAARGFAAIEYFLFDPEGGNPAIIQQFREGLQGKRRCAYLMAIIRHLIQQVEIVANAWSPHEDHFLVELIRAGKGSPTYPTVHQAISDLVNRMIEGLEKAMKNKLRKPFQGNGKTPWPEAVESWRGANSLTNILHMLQGLQALYTGTNATVNGPGFDDYLTALGSPLGQQISRQIQVAIEAVRAIPPPLHTALSEHPQLVKSAYQELQTLLILLKADMTNLLSITVDFSDNDGD